jgi:uncharacterized protein (DUF2235 family)
MTIMTYRHETQRYTYPGSNVMLDLKSQANAALDKAEKFSDLALETFCYLAGRWEDEQRYEDIADYAQALTPFADQVKIGISKMTKSPFGAVLLIDGWRVNYKLVKGDLKIQIDQRQWRKRQAAVLKPN